MRTVLPFPSVLSEIQSFLMTSCVFRLAYLAVTASIVYLLYKMGHYFLDIQYFQKVWTHLCCNLLYKMGLHGHIVNWILHTIFFIILKYCLVSCIYFQASFFFFFLSPSRH